MKEKEIAHCELCGGTSLSALAWVDYNTQEFIDWDDVHDDIYCCDCDKIVGVVYEKQWRTCNTWL